MKRRALIVGALIVVLLTGLIPDAGAQRWGHGHGYGRGYGHGYGYGYRRPARVWVAPPPVVVVGPRYGYYHRPHYYRPRPRYYGYNRPYGYRRW
jgi:hypothetical protein